MLFLLRFFLQHIEQQLKTCSTVSVPTYRGQFMTNQQIEFFKNSINKNPLRFSSYIIAKKNREQVLKSLQNAINKNNSNSVLFHIETNQIGKQYEEFILFPITTHFRVVSIDYQNDIYHVKITVSNLNSCFDRKQNNAIDLGHRLRDLGRLDEAEKVFNRLSSQYPIGTSKLYDGLARIAQDKGLYDISLQLYEKSLSKSSSKDRPHCFNNIGCVYDYLEQYDVALEFYSKALKLMRNDIDRAMCFNNIGITLANELKYRDAHQSLQQSLAIRLKLLPQNHPDLGITHANIGVLCSCMDQVDLAFEHYQEALKIFLHNNLPVYKAIVYQNMAQICSRKNQLSEALNYYQQAASIFRQIRPSNHPNLIYIEQSIDRLTQMK
jgi:tetratricopeptide (TPR) repeat protein